MNFKFWVLLFIPFVYTSIDAQKKSSVDSIITFKVFGNCEMCKNRIEKAAKGKGVASAMWDVDTKMLSLNYDPSITSPEKVQERIADVGHDTPLKKAKGFVYDELPECCHYREKETGSHNDQHENAPSRTGVVTGVVIGMDNKGNFHPLQGASVISLGTGKGVMTGDDGIFKITSDTVQRLIISYTGYESDTIAVHPAEEIRVVMRGGGANRNASLVSKSTAPLFAHAKISPSLRPARCRSPAGNRLGSWRKGDGYPRQRRAQRPGRHAGSGARRRRGLCGKVVPLGGCSTRRRRT